MSRKHDASRRRVLESLAAAGGTLAGFDALAQTDALTPEAQAAAASAASINHPGRPDDILIGQSSTFSGPLGFASVKPNKGMEIAFEEFNKKGGVGGRHVRIIKMDDAYNAKRCVENCTKLIDEHKVVALHALASTGNVGAVLPLLLDRKIPLVCTYTGSPTVRAKYHPYNFTGTASYRDELVEMVRNLVATQRKDLGLVYHNSPFGQLMLPIAEDVCKEYGALFVSKKPADIDGKNAEAQIISMAETRPQAIIVISFGANMVPIIRSIKKYIGVPVYVISVGMNGAVIDLLGDDSRGVAVTRILPYPWRETTPLMREFNRVMRERKIVPDYEYLLGYLNARVLIEGLKRLKPKNVTGESIAKAMESLGKFDMGGYPLNFSQEQHHGSKFVEITIIGPNKRILR